VDVLDTRKQSDSVHKNARSIGIGNGTRGSSLVGAKTTAQQPLGWLSVAEKQT